MEKWQEDYIIEIHGICGDVSEGEFRNRLINCGFLTIKDFTNER